MGLEQKDIHTLNDLSRLGRKATLLRLDELLSDPLVEDDLHAEFLETCLKLLCELGRVL